MNRGDVGLVLGIMGFVAGVYAAFEVTTTNVRLADAQKVHLTDNDSLAGLGERVEKLDQSHKELQRRVNGLDANPRTSGDRLKALEERVDALEKSRTAGGAETPKQQQLVATKGQAPQAKLTREQARALKNKIASGEATDEEKAQLGEAIEALEGAVKDTPRDIDERFALADLYIAKLQMVPDGMERGMWSMKAVAQWNAVLDVDPNNWQAHYSLGVNYSFWPDQFNKRPDAIKELEAARKSAESGAPDPKYATTYLQLRQLYLKDGRTDDAKKVLDDGLRLYPDDEELKKAKDGAK
jgi:tetratricopeptide (TPR) repeat protein